jgi:hypothetical protein
MFSRFNKFHSRWLKKHTEEEEVRNCTDWLDGVISDPNRSSEETERQDESCEKEGTTVSSKNEETNDAKTTKSSIMKTSSNQSTSSSKTRKVELDREDSAPFRTFCKYKVDSS